MNKRIWVIGLLAALSLSLVSRAYGGGASQYRRYTQSYDPANTRIVYTIAPDAGQRVTISCDDAAATLMAAVDEPGESSTISMTLTNNTDRTYRFSGAEFTTENRVSRDVSEQDPPAPTGLVRTFCPPDTGSIGGTVGFDGKRIPYSMNVLRCITRPLIALCAPGRTAAEVTLEQVQNADAAAKRQHRSYAGYLLAYYQSHCSACAGATSLKELEPEHLREILGSAVGDNQGQSEIRYPRQLPAAELSSARYALFRQYGWSSQLVEKDGTTYATQDYELLETDPELIELGYWYLYTYGMFFTFDDTAAPLAADAADEITADGLQMMNYLRHTGRAEEEMQGALSALVLKPGESVTLDHIAFAAQLPNAYDARSMDFGFSLTFVQSEGGSDGSHGTVEPSPPNQPEDNPSDQEPTTPSTNPGAPASPPDPPIEETDSPTDPSHAQAVQTGDAGIAAKLSALMLLSGTGFLLCRQKRQDEDPRLR